MLKRMRSVRPSHPKNVQKSKMDVSRNTLSGYCLARQRVAEVSLLAIV